MSENTTKPQSQITLSQESMTSLGDLTTLIKFANELCKSEALPPTYRNGANVLVALQTGKEMGLQPMQSLKMLYTVNGSIKPWGTAYPYLLKRAGYKINTPKHDKTICHVIVNKGDETYEYTATKDDISATSKAFSFAPKEKLFFHACARIINYYLPEVMGGMNFDNDVEDFGSSSTSAATEATFEPVTKRSDLQIFIEEEAQTQEALVKATSNKQMSESESQAYAKRFNELEPAKAEPKTETPKIKAEPVLAEDGGLAIEGTNPTTKI